MYSERTNGRYVSDDETLLKQLKDDYADHVIDHCIATLQELDMSEDAIRTKMEKRLRK